MRKRRCASSRVIRPPRPSRPPCATTPARCACRPGLQHEQLAVLDGELDVAHVAVVGLERVHDARRVRPAQSGKWTASWSSGNVLRTPATTSSPWALSRKSPTAPALAGRRIAGECDAGARVVAGVAEHHHLHVDGGTEVVGDPLDAAVVTGAPTVPRPEHGGNRLLELLPRIARERPSRLVGDGDLQHRDEVLETDQVEGAGVLDAVHRQHPLDGAVQAVAVDLEHDAGRTGRAGGGRRRRRTTGRRSARRGRSATSAVRPRLRTVSIMPGIENAAPERTETSSGRSGSPKRWPVAVSSSPTTTRSSSTRPSGMSPSRGRHGRRRW